MAEKKTNIQYTPRPNSLSTLVAQNGVWVDSLSLDNQKKSAKEEIDIAAENVRRKYISSYPGQIGVYNEKYLDAKAYADAGYPEISVSGSEYPFIRAEAEAMNGTSQEAADLIIETREGWIILASEIEKLRRSGKINIDQAVNSDEINTIKESIFALLEVI